MIPQSNPTKLNLHNNETLLHLSRKDSLLIKVNKHKEDTNKAIALFYLAKIISNEGHADSSVFLLNKSLELSNKLNFYWGIVQSNYQLGLILLDQGKYNESFQKYITARKQCELRGDSLGIANSILLIGNSKIRINDHKGALNFFNEALKLYTRINNKPGVAQSYYKIATLYNMTTDYENAFINFDKALKLFTELKDSVFIANCYGDMAIMFDEKKEFKKSGDYFFKALAIFEKFHDAQSLTRLYHNIAYSFFVQKKYDQVLLYTTKCDLLAKKSKMTEIIIANEALLSAFYEKNQNYKLALEHLKTAHQYSDSLETNEVSAAIINTENLAKSEKEKLLIKTEQEKKDIIVQKELKIQRLIIIISIIGVIFLLSFAFILTKNYKRKIETTKLITSKNIEIINQKASIEGQEIERKRISKELHDGIGGSLAALKLRLSDYVSKHHTHELDDIISSIGDIGKEVRSISHNLTPPVIAQSTLYDLLLLLVNKYNLLNKIKINFEYLASPQIDSANENTKRELYRIVQELLHNSFKYSQASQIRIDVFLEGNILFLQIEDNGIGFVLEKESNGIGLKNIENRINLLQGKFSIDSKINRGTTISIEIPI